MARSAEDDRAGVIDPPAGIVGDLPDEAVGVLDECVEDTAEVALLRALQQDGSSRDHGIDGRLDIGATVDIVGEGYPGDLSGGAMTSEVSSELLGVEESQHQPGCHLEEDDFPGHVQQRLPAQPLDLELPGEVQVGGGEGQKVDVLLHTFLLKAPRPGRWSGVVRPVSAPWRRSRLCFPSLGA